MRRITTTMANDYHETPCVGFALQSSIISQRVGLYSRIIIIRIMENIPKRIHRPRSALLGKSIVIFSTESTSPPAESQRLALIDIKSHHTISHHGNNHGKIDVSAHLFECQSESSLINKFKARFIISRIVIVQKIMLIMCIVYIIIPNCITQLQLQWQVSATN